jgi:D-hexose-6-phosphate mutarotase
MTTRRRHPRSDLGDTAWRGMVCVETGNIADNEVRLAADGEHQMSTEISVDAWA